MTDQCTATWQTKHATRRERGGKGARSTATDTSSSLAHQAARPDEAGTHSPEPRHTEQPGPTRQERTARNPGTANSRGPEAPQRAIQQEARSAVVLRAPACVSSQVELNVAAGDGLDQLARVVLNRVVEQLVRRVGLDELALLHDNDVVGDLADDRQVVRDEQV